MLPEIKQIKKLRFSDRPDDRSLMTLLGKMNALILVFMLVTSSIIELSQLHKSINANYAESSREFEESRAKEKDINFCSDLYTAFFVQLHLLPAVSLVVITNNTSTVTEITKVLGPHRISLPPPSVLS